MSERPPRNEPGLLPEPDNSQESIPTPEQIESEQVAEKKLETLHSPDFKVFVIRFVNIEEYRRILTKGNFETNQAWKSRGNESFQQYLERVRNRWSWAMHQQADWSIGDVNLKTYETLIAKIKQLNAEVIAEQGTEKSREETIKRFKDFLKEEVDNATIFSQEGWHMLYKNAQQYRQLPELEKKVVDLVGNKKAEQLINQLRSMARKREDRQKIASLLIKQKKKGLKALGDQLYTNYEAENYYGNKLKEMSDFLFEEKSDKKSLRDVINILSYTPYEFPSSLRNPMGYKYHVALVFSPEAIIREYGDDDSGGWYWLKNKKGEKDWREYNPKDQLLGAITVMPNKELRQELVARSSHSGKLAHPVFDNQGKVRYPKQSSSQAPEAPE